MKEKIKIVVMLSTYNGSDFITQQLDSINKQVSVSVKLIIRDDGSTDDTYSKLETFKKNNDSINIILIKGTNIGYVKSFYYLAKFALDNYPDIQYFSFADQDDVWLPDKLITAVNSIHDEDHNKPILYCSNTLLTDQYLNPIGLFRLASPEISAQNCLIQNIVTGCTSVFNRKAAQLYVDHQIKNIVVHDQYLYILCTLFGKTIYDEESHMLYRQHGRNQIGKPNVFKRFLTSFKKLFSCSHSLENRAQLVYTEFRNELNGEALNAVKKLALYRESLRNRLALLFDSNYKYDSRLSNLIFRLKIIIGRV